MYKKNSYSWLKHWDFTIVDILCMELSFWLAVWIRSGFLKVVYYSVYQNVSVALIFLNICIVFFAQSYKNVLKRNRGDEIRKCVLHITCVELLMLFYMYFVRSAYFFSRFVFLAFWVFYFVFTLAGRILLKKYLCSQKRQNAGTRSMLLVVSDDGASKLVRHISKTCYGNIKVTGVAVLAATEKEEIAGVPIVACGEHILEYIQENWVDEVFLAPVYGRRIPRKMMRALSDMGITIHIKIDDMEEPGISRTVEKMCGYTVLTEAVRTETPSQAFFKRLMDIAGGLVGVAITGIAFVFVAPIIFVKSPGPVFFSQVRVGRNGKQFKIYKFRSMYLDAEERKKELLAQNNIKDGMMFKMDDDPRIIKGIGHFIRESSIDELPQFWNVLKGEMSLVGTRPPTLDEWSKYEFHHRKRLATKPGITGMWQVSGRSDITDFEEVVKLDTQYIQKWSLLLDVKIILKTVVVVFGKKGSK